MAAAFEAGIRATFEDAKVLQLLDEVERLRAALKGVRARTYSSDRGCALQADAVAAICDIADAALSHKGTGS
jgi:hypothetical protein